MANMALFAKKRGVNKKLKIDLIFFSSFILLFLLLLFHRFQIYDIFFGFAPNGLQAGAEKLGSFKRVSQQRPVLKVKTLFVVCNTSC
jgi:hypothetical protein